MVQLNSQGRILNKDVSSSFLVDCGLTESGFKIYEFQDTYNSGFSGFPKVGDLDLRKIIRIKEREFTQNPYQPVDHDVVRRFLRHKAIAPLFLDEDSAIMPEQIVSTIPCSSSEMESLANRISAEFHHSDAVVLKLPSGARAEGVEIVSLVEGDLEESLTKAFSTTGRKFIRRGSEIAPVLVVQNAEKPIPLGRNGEFVSEGGRNAVLRPVFKLGTKANKAVVEYINGYNKFAPGEYNGRGFVGDNFFSKPTLTGYNPRPSSEVASRIREELVPSLQRVMTRVMNTDFSQLLVMMREQKNTAYNLLADSFERTPSRTF